MADPNGMTPSEAFMQRWAGRLPERVRRVVHLRRERQSIQRVVHFRLRLFFPVKVHFRGEKVQLCRETVRVEFGVLRRRLRGLCRRLRPGAPENGGRSLRVRRRVVRESRNRKRLSRRFVVALLLVVVLVVGIIIKVVVYVVVVQPVVVVHHHPATSSSSSFLFSLSLFSLSGLSFGQSRFRLFCFGVSLDFYVDWIGKMFTLVEYFLRRTKKQILQSRFFSEREKRTQTEKGKHLYPTQKL